MSLAKKLNEITSTSESNNIGCSVGRLIKSLSEEDTEALRNALQSPASTRSIYQALRAEGFTVDRALLGLHRKGFCQCKEPHDD